MRGSSCIFTSQGWKDIRTWSDRRNPTRHKVQLDRSDVRDGVDRVRTHSRLATAASQQGARARVSRRGATEVDNGAQLARVTVQECGWFKPKARKNRRTIQPILVDRPLHQRTLLPAIPEVLVGIDCAHNVLKDTALFEPVLQSTDVRISAKRTQPRNTRQNLRAGKGIGRHQISARRTHMAKVLTKHF
jgi:hypothetical protein